MITAISYIIKKDKRCTLHGDEGCLTFTLRMREASFGKAGKMVHCNAEAIQDLDFVSADGEGRTPGTKGRHGCYGGNLRI